MVHLWKFLQVFLRDDSVGNKKFSLMPPPWTEICSEASMGSRLKVSDPRVSDVAGSLTQEFSEIALNLTDHLGVDCKAKIPVSFVADAAAWQKHIVKGLVEKRLAKCAYDIPNAANPLEVEIDLAKNTISVGMEMKVPLERSTLAGKINFLLRQLKNAEDGKSYVKVRWNSRAADEFIEMKKLEPSSFKDRGSNTTILSLTPMMQIHSSKVFNSRKNFISELEGLVTDFYDTHAQYLKAWVPKAPKPIEETMLDE